MLADTAGIIMAPNTEQQERRFLEFEFALRNMPMQYASEFIAEYVSHMPRVLFSWANKSGIELGEYLSFFRDCAEDIITGDFLRRCGEGYRGMGAGQRYMPVAVSVQIINSVFTKKLAQAKDEWKLVTALARAVPEFDELIAGYALTALVHAAISELCDRVTKLPEDIAHFVRTFYHIAMPRFNMGNMR